MAAPARWASWWRKYEAGEWEPGTRDLLASTLKPGDLFVDVGAWIGPVTLWALEMGAHVIAIEPDPVACAELRKVAPDAEIWECAVTTGAPFALLGRCPRPRGEYGDSMSRIADEGIEVRGATLPEILGDRVPALVTVDVEGYEAELCPVIAPWLAERRVPLQVAFHGTMPEREWFAGYGEVYLPDGRRGVLVAKP